MFNYGLDTLRGRGTQKDEAAGRALIDRAAGGADRSAALRTRARPDEVTPTPTTGTRAAILPGCRIRRPQGMRGSAQPQAARRQTASASAWVTGSGQSPGSDEAGHQPNHLLHQSGSSETKGSSRRRSGRAATARRDKPLLAQRQGARISIAAVGQADLADFAGFVCAAARKQRRCAGHRAGQQRGFLNTIASRPVTWRVPS